MRHYLYTLAVAAATAWFGVCHAASDDYMVIDLSGGASATNYPVTYLANVPAGGWTDTYKTNLLVLRKIPHGTFMMGGTTNLGANDQVAHEVTLTNDYYMGVFEVTEAQWMLTGLIEGANTAKAISNQGEGNINLFLSTIQEKSGKPIQLPTEAQWEYACRAGSNTDYCFGSDTNLLVNYAWYKTNNVNNTKHVVGLLQTNAWGLADVHGNVQEICEDTNVVTYVRGGSYISTALGCRSFSRGVYTQLPYVGFRVSLTIPREYVLTVVQGQGSGNYLKDQTVAITANAPAAWHTFDQWTGDTATVSNVLSAATTLVMPASDATVTATYKPVIFTVTVSNGTAAAAGGTNGQSVAIWAQAPGAQQVFDRWTGDTQTVQNVYASNTTVRIQGTNVSVTATYREAPYTLTVYSGSGSGQYASGDLVFVAANPASPGQAFNYWSVVPGNAPLGGMFNPFGASTWLTMPPTHTILTAVYTNIPTYTLTVNGGTGGGSYTNGHVAAIAAEPPPAHHTFLWTGQTGTVADVTAWSTTLAMPPSNVAVTATYPPVLYALTVNGGQGSGSYTNGQVVTVAATNLPSAGHAFDFWSGDTNTLADVLAATTTVTIAGTATLTPVYIPVKKLDNLYMVVDLTASQPSQAVSYRDDVPAGGWVGDYQTNRLVLRKLPAGNFLMGSPTSEAGRTLDETRHSVTHTKVFYIGLFEVTQGQWYRVKGNWPSYANGADRAARPVERVSYVDIRGATNSANWPSTSAVDSGSFMGQLRAKTGDTAFDLPTEAQWEYACRAGTTGAYGGTGVLSTMGWYSANSGGATKTVGQKTANAWGLYDMHGNVHELCLDWYAGDYSATNQFDPPGAVGSSQNRRIMRGGTYSLTADLCRSAYRGNLLPTNTFAFAGLRVARTAEAAYRLTVVDGLVNTGGLYFAGTQISISPVRKEAWRVFDHWQVEPAGAQLGALFAAEQADTVVTQPALSVTVTAVYALYTLLTVTNGTGSGAYESGQDVAIAAAPAPAGSVFDRWTGGTAGVADVMSASTTVHVTGGVVSLTATYRPLVTTLLMVR